MYNEMKQELEELQRVGKELRDKCLTDYIKETERLEKLNAEILAELDRKRDECNGMAHLIVESCIVPGVSCSCRCDECRDVAKSMAEAGYLDLIKDRWWEAKAEGRDER